MASRFSFQPFTFQLLASSVLIRAILVRLISELQVGIIDHGLRDHTDLYCSPSKRRHAARNCGALLAAASHTIEIVNGEVGVREHVAETGNLLPRTVGSRSVRSLGNAFTASR